MASIGFLALALFFVVVDVTKRWPGGWSGAPFRYLGMVSAISELQRHRAVLSGLTGVQNSIIIYVGSETLGGYFPFQWHAYGDFQSHAESLGSCAVGVLAWMTVARVLYLKKTFVNL
jgi:hypothetical protein